MTAHALHDFVVLAQAQVDIAWTAGLICIPALLYVAAVGYLNL